MSRVLRWSEERLAEHKNLRRKGVGNCEPVMDLGNPLERDVLAAVLAALKLHPKVAWVARMNSGGMQDGHGHHVRFGFPGLSDIIGQLNDGRLLCVECKRQKTHPTPDQQAFLDRVNRHGGLAFVARSVADVMLALGGTAA